MTRRDRLYRSLRAAAIVAVVGWACSDGGTGPGIAHSLSVLPPQATLTLGETLQASVSLRDVNGSELPTSAIVWTSSDMGRVNVSQTGLLSALAVGGPVTVTASAGSLTAQILVTVVQGDATQLSITTQPSAAGTSGVVLGRQPVIQLRDAAGQASPTSGVQVTAVLAEGQGTLSGATVATDQNGRATFASLAISGGSGSYRLRFEATGLTPAVSDVVNLSAAASLTFTAQPSATAQSGVTFATQPRLVVSTVGGSPVAGEPVTASIASGGGTLSGTTTVVTDASGVAQFTDLSLSGLAGNRTLRFSAGLVSVVSDPIALASGDVPASLVIVTQPSSGALNGVPFAQQPVIEVQDAAGNPIPGASLEATVATGAGTLGGTTSRITNANGRVVFTDLKLTGSLGQYTLSFTSDPISVQSAAITLSAGTPSSITVATQPSATAQSGAAFAQQPAVDVRDAGGNLLVGMVVTASIATGGGTLGGTATATTNDVGRATFSGLAISGLVGPRTLQFSSGSATATSGSIQLQPGALAQLQITTQPSSNATNDVAFAQQPVVQASDAAGNGISGLDVVAVIQSGGGSLGGTATATTNGSGGVAAFSNLKITGTVGPRTLRFSVGGVGVTSGTVNLSAGAPVGISILTQPPALAINAVTFQQSPQVELLDVSDNPVPGANVVVSVASGGGTLNGTTSATTGGAGTVTFSNLAISGSPGPRTLRFTSSGQQTISSTVHVGLGQGSYIDLQYCGSIAAQRMDVYMPSNSFQRPLPVAVYIHGGSWTGHDKSEEDLLLWANTRQELLSRGFVVATLNYRLATPDDNKWPAQVHDVKCAIRHLRAEAGDYGADGRIGVWGASAGGHLASMVGVTDPGTAPHLEGNEGYSGWSSRVSAAVTIGGISDLTQGPDHPEIQFEGGEWAFTQWPGPDTELDHASPLWWASSDDPPFLIVHGEQDATVLYPQAPRLDDALDDASASSTLVPVVNGGHELQNVGGTATPSIPDVMEQIADFFDTHVR